MLIFEKNSIFNFSNPTFYNLILPYKTQILTYLARRFNKRDRTLLYVCNVVIFYLSPPSSTHNRHSHSHNTAASALFLPESVWITCFI
jgi:hypothetical protein